MQYNLQEPRIYLEPQHLPGVTAGGEKLQEGKMEIGLQSWIPPQHLAEQNRDQVPAWREPLEADQHKGLWTDRTC